MRGISPSQRAATKPGTSSPSRYYGEVEKLLFLKAPMEVSHFTSSGDVFPDFGSSVGGQRLSGSSRSIYP